MPPPRWSSRRAPRRRAPVRRALLVPALLSLGLALAGCVPTVGAHGGQSAPRAMLDLELQTPGVSNAVFTTTASANEGEGGLGARTTQDAELTVTITDYNEITAPAPALDFLARYAWSIGDVKPTGSVGIAIAGPWSESDLAWYGTAAAAFGTSISTGAVGEVFIPVSRMTTLYGAWPGRTPKKLAFVGRTSGASAPTPSPIGHLSFDAVSRGFQVSALRSSVDGVAYAGTITASVLEGGTVLATDTDSVRTGDSGTVDPRVFFELDPTAKKGSGPIHYRLEFTPQDGFDTGSVTLP